MDKTIVCKKVDPEKKVGKLELVESFRAISAFFIVLFHATELFQLKFNREFLFNLFKFGDSGVDFFFVLSGFVLFFSQAKYIGNQSKFKDFIFKRFIRIYPIYWAINLVIIPIYFIAPALGKGHERDFKVIIESLLLIPHQQAPVLVVAWFLSHIVFFYLLFGLLIALRPKFAIPVIAIWMIGTIIFFVTGNPPQEDLSLGFVFSPYNVEFLGGVLTAHLVKKYSLNRKFSLITLVVGITFFLLFGILENYFLSNINNKFFDINYYEVFAYGMSSILIVIGSASIDARIDNHLKVNPILLKLASASYVIYLIHYPILSVLTKIIGVIGTTSYVIQSIASSSPALLLYLLVTLFTYPLSVI
jgi:exopolysaccharide production protein ExoZ